MEMPYGPEGRRAWQPREMAMVSEWARKAYPGAYTLTRVRLGLPHPELIWPELGEAELDLLRVYSRWCDALILTDREAVLVEGKIRPRIGPTEALELYERLFRTDPAYRRWWPLPIRKVFLYAIEDPVLIRMAREKGIACIQYQPDWLPRYLEILSARERRAPLTREEA